MQVYIGQLGVIGNRGTACILQIDCAVTGQLGQLRSIEQRSAIQSQRFGALRICKDQFLQTAVVLVAPSSSLS